MFLLGFWGSDTNAGLLCFNTTSLKTLENCTSIVSLICYPHIQCNIELENLTLDLSHCELLKKIILYRWNSGKLKLPKSIVDLSCTYIYTEINIDSNTESINKIYLSEFSSAYYIHIIKQLAENKINVNELELHSANDIKNVTDVKCFLDEDLRCDWLKCLIIDRKGWSVDLWTSQKIFEGLSYISDNSIQELSLSNYGSTNLNFIKNFTKLKKLIITGSKVVDISGLEPQIDQIGKCISGFPDLEELTIQNSVTDITSVGKLTKLKRLNMSGNNINNGIEGLSNLQELEYVNLSNCNSLSLSNRYVDIGTKEGLDSFVNIFKNLHESGELNELYLNGTGIKNIKSKLENSGKVWTALSCDG